MCPPPPPKPPRPVAPPQPPEESAELELEQDARVQARKRNSSGTRALTIPLSGLAPLAPSGGVVTP